MAVLGRDGDEHVRPCDMEKTPAHLNRAEAERGFRHVRAQGLFIGRHQVDAPLTRWSGTRSKRTRHSGQDARMPICVPDAGRSCVPEICRRCSPASSSVMWNLCTAAQCLTRATVVPGAKAWCAVSPAKLTSVATWRQLCKCILPPAAPQSVPMTMWSSRG